jgi:hypothetical protein
LRKPCYRGGEKEPDLATADLFGLRPRGWSRRTSSGKRDERIGVVTMANENKNENQKNQNRNQNNENRNQNKDQNKNENRNNENRNQDQNQQRNRQNAQ